MAPQNYGVGRESFFWCNLGPFSGAVAVSFRVPFKGHPPNFLTNAVFLGRCQVASILSDKVSSLTTKAKARGFVEGWLVFMYIGPG